MKRKTTASLILIGLFLVSVFSTSIRAANSNSTTDTTSNSGTLSAQPRALLLQQTLNQVPA